MAFLNWPQHNMQQNTQGNILNNSGNTHIEINGAKIKLRFGLPACQAFYEMVLSEDSAKYLNGTKLTAIGIAKLLYAGYCNNCLIDDVLPELTFGAFMLYVEDSILDSPGVLEEVVKVFENSRYTRKMADQTEEALTKLDEEKKRLIGSTLSRSGSTSLGSLKSNITRAPTENLSLKRKGTNETKPRKQRKK